MPFDDGGAVAGKPDGDDGLKPPDEWPGTFEWLTDGTGKLLVVPWPNAGWLKTGVNVGAALNVGGACGP